MRSGTGVVWAGLALAGGLCAGRWSTAAGPDPALVELRAMRDRLEEVARASAAAGRGACAAAVDGASIRAELERAVATACAPGERAATAGPAPREERRPVHPEVAAEASHALSQGRDFVREALARGTWGDEQARTFRLLLARVDEEGRAELLAAILPAINEGRLQVTASGPAL